MVEQLQNLWLNDDNDVLEQVLRSAEPDALSELSAAHNSESVIPLVTEKDGREFFIYSDLLAYSNWDGQYPMEFSPANKCMRKLSDPTLADEKITTYQNDALKEILDAVCATEDAVEFRKPVQVLRPKIWDNYKALIAEPIDLESMQHKLYHRTYATMWGFRRQVDLIEENARKNNGDRNASIIAAAIKVRSDIYHRMDEIPAEPPLGHHGVSLVRRIIYADDHGSASTAGSVVKASHKGAKQLGAGVRHTDNPTYVLPLGRLGVARKAGDKEVIPTPYIVVMEVESCYKALWLIKDNYTPVGLPSDKKSLLDFGGHYNFTIAKLAGDIVDFKPRSDGGWRATSPQL